MTICDILSNVDLAAMTKEIQILEKALASVRHTNKGKLELLRNSSFCPTKKYPALKEILHYFSTIATEIQKENTAKFLRERNTIDYKKEVYQRIQLSDDEAKEIENSLDPTLDFDSRLASYVAKIHEALQIKIKKELEYVPDDVLLVSKEDIQNKMTNDLMQLSPTDQGKFLKLEKMFHQYVSLSKKLEIPIEKEATQEIETLNNVFIKITDSLNISKKLDAIARHITLLFQSNNVYESNFRLAQLGEFLRESCSSFNSKKYNTVELLSSQYNISCDDIKTALISKIATQTFINSSVALSTLACQEIHSSLACKADNSSDDSLRYTTQVMSLGTKCLNEFLCQPIKHDIKLLSHPDFIVATSDIKNVLTPNRFARKIYNEAIVDIKKTGDTVASKIYSENVADDLTSLSNQYFSSIPTKDSTLLFKLESTKKLKAAEKTLGQCTSWPRTVAKFAFALCTAGGFLIDAAMEAHSWISKGESRFFKTQDAKKASKAKRIVNSLNLPVEIDNSNGLRN